MEYRTCLCLWVPRGINSRFCTKTRYQMFLLVSVRRVGAHPGGHQHGVSLQISINLGNTFLRISRIRNILLTWILARDLRLYLLNEFDFYFDLLWMAWHWKPAIGEDAKVKGARKVDRAGKSPSSTQFPPVFFCVRTFSIQRTRLSESLEQAK